MRRSVGAAAAVMVLVALPGCRGLSGNTEVKWDAPPPKVVSAWDKEHPFTYHWESDIDDSGRWVVFASSVRDGPAGVYLRDMRKRTITRIDSWVEGTPPPPNSEEADKLFGEGAGSPAISADGRHIAFSYSLDVLMKADANGHTDVFRYDRITKKLELVSTTPTGQQGDKDSSGPAISGDGRFIAFASSAKNFGDRTHRSEIYVKDMTTGKLTLVSRGSGGFEKYEVFGATISTDGNRVAFVTTAGDLIPDDTNRADDAFVADVSTGEITRVSVTSEGKQLKPLEYAESASNYRDGAEDAVISGDGNVVAFVSHANGLVPEDRNNNVDIFVRDLEKQTTERVTITSDGEDAYGDDERECGTNGQCFTFISSWAPSLSHDGRYVAFISGAPRLEPKGGDHMGGSSDDVFVHDRAKRLTLQVNRDWKGRPAKASNIYPGAISGNGRWLTFSSDGKILEKREGRGENGDVYLQQVPIPFEIA